MVPHRTHVFVEALLVIALAGSLLDGFVGVVALPRFRAKRTTITITAPIARPISRLGSTDSELVESELV